MAVTGAAAVDELNAYVSNAFRGPTLSSVLSTHPPNDEHVDFDWPIFENLPLFGMICLISSAFI